MCFISLGTFLFRRYFRYAHLQKQFLFGGYCGLYESESNSKKKPHLNLHISCLDDNLTSPLKYMINISELLSLAIFLIQVS